MSTKKHTKKADKKSDNDWKNEDFVLRAVVLAESFNQRFLPITYEKPRTLLNFFSGKIIDFTMKWLVDSGVSEVLVVVCSHSEVIEEHILTSGLLKQHSNFNVLVTTVAKEICDSVGDVMRELEHNYKHIISQDFILLTGFMISAVNLNALIVQHKEYKKINKNNLMTVVFKDYNLMHKNSEFDTTYFTLIDPIENKLAYMKKFCSLHEGIPYSYLQFNRKLTATCNLHPSGVYICSSIVPQLFVDNFDFQGINCLLNNVLNREQILFDYSIHYITLKNDAYLSNISTLNSYYNTLMDLINRWAYPITLEAIGYRLHKNLVYLGKNCQFNSTKYEPIKMVVDMGTVVGFNSTIKHSYIGSNCSLGDNLTILDSVIWDAVTIGEGSTVNNSLIANNVTIGKNVTIDEGCIISYNCTIPDNVNIPKQTYLMLDDESIPNLIDSTTLFDNVDSNTKIHQLPDNLKMHYTWGKCKRPFNNICREFFANQLLLDDENSNDFDNDYHDDQSKFQSEVHDSILFGVRDSLPTEAIILEINSSKHAYNICVDEMASYIIPTCLNIILTANISDHTKSDDNTNTNSNLSLSTQHNNNDDELLFNYKKIFPTVRELLLNYSREDEQQRALIELIENYFFQCSGSDEKAHFIKFYLKFVHDLYEHDVLDDYNIVEWNKSTREVLANSAGNDDPQSQLEFRNENLDKFIGWLEEASEESDDDDSDN